MGHVPFHRVLSGPGMCTKTQSKTGPCPQQAQPMQAGKAGRQRQPAEHLPSSPRPRAARIPGILQHPPASGQNPPSGQHREDGDASASPSAGGRTGMASLPCNTDSLYKVPLNPYPQKGPDLGLIHISCSGGAILPTAAALLSWRAAAGWQSPAGAGIPAMPAMPCPPLRPQRVRSPAEQEAGISQARGARPGCRGGEGRQRCGSCCCWWPRPSLLPASAGTCGGFQGALPLGTPAVGQGASSLLCRVIFFII